MLTEDLIAAAIPDAPEANVSHFADALASACTEFDIGTPRRQAAFLAQVAIESGGLKRVSENLNYKASGLLRVFHTHFSDDEAENYAGQPERIANRVYADRMGNGDEASGDGWRYRGRGLIQMTGRDNYRACGQALGKDLEEDPEYLESAEGAARSAAWFWDKHGLNALADAGDIDRISRKINGGDNGIAERREAYATAFDALEA